MDNNSTSGCLYVVATPIGHLDDISFRAVETLRKVHCIAAEDTRVTRYLLNHFQIQTALISLHAYNERERCDHLAKRLQAGESIALVSDAGTPLISDPGYIVVKYVRDLGFKVVPIPGACAAIAALSVAGLPTDRFVFEGFLPAKSGMRSARLQSFVKESRTVIFYEAPHRLQACVKEMIEIFGGEREVALARELTKIYETVHNDSLEGLYQYLLDNPDSLRGECVILLAGCQASEEINEEVKRVLEILSEELPKTQAVKLAAKLTGIKKNQLYKLAMLSE